MYIEFKPLDRIYVVCLSRKLNLVRLCFLINFFWLRIFRNTYILLDVLVCSIAVYFYELCRILTSP